MLGEIQQQQFLVLVILRPWYNMSVVGNMFNFYVRTIFAYPQKTAQFFT